MNSWLFPHTRFAFAFALAFTSVALHAETLRQAAAAATPVLYGSAVTFGPIGQSQYDDAARLQLQIVTAENEMKMAHLRPTQAAFNWTAADRIVNWARAAGQKVRGHTLVWHDSVPTWVSGGGFSPAQLQTILFEHIDAVGSHYAGTVSAWDVVNEAFLDNGTLRSSIWHNQPGIGFAGMGTRYIEEAFRRARAIDPAAQLFYNDFSSETLNAKSDAIFAMCQDFKTRGVPIDGVGFQMHLSLGAVNKASLRANFERFSDLGLDLNVTELDVRLPVNGIGVASAVDLAAQAEVYWDAVGTALSNPRVTAVQTWGFSDAHSWIPSTFPGFGAALPFDKTFQKKPAYWALWNVFANQAEKLPAIGTSPLDVVTDPLLSAGKARRLMATGAGGTATFTMKIPHEGSWNVRVGVRRSAEAGQFQLAMAPEFQPFTDVGSVQETYAANNSVVDLDLGNVNVTFGRKFDFRFTVVGKHASSSGHQLTIDYIRLTPIGASTISPATISPIVDQAVPDATATAAIPFLIADKGTPGGEGKTLVTAESLNPSVLPDGQLLLGGSAANRTITVTPLAGAYDESVVVLKVGNGQQESYETFAIVPGSANLAYNGHFEGPDPTENWATQGGGVTLTVVQGFGGGSAGQLSGRTQPFHGVGQHLTNKLASGVTYHLSGWLRVSGATSAPVKFTLMTVDGAGMRYSQIVAGTATNNGWVQLSGLFTPRYTGTATDLFVYAEGPPAGVDLLVDDLRVEGAGPSITGLTNRTIVRNHSTGPLPFTVGDAQTGPATVSVTATASNPTMVPNANIVFGGSGANRTITITPAADQGGTTVITLTASDGVTSTSSNFLLTVTSNTPPVVTLLGANPLILPIGASYNDPGATAIDAEDGPLPTILVENNVVPDVPGNYSVKWSATDADGLTGIAVRQVEVIQPTEVTIFAVAAVGGQVPGQPDGVKFAGFGTAQSQVFTGSLFEGSKKVAAIFAANGSLLVKAGGDAPDLPGTVIAKLGASSGDAALATLKSESDSVTAKNDTVLLAGLVYGPVRIAAREGAELPGRPGISIKKFGAIDGNGQTTFFLATLQGGTGPTKVNGDNDTALCAALSDGSVRVLVREGDRVDGKTVGIIGVLVGAKGSLAEGRWRVTGDVTVGVRLSFTNKEEGLFTIFAYPDISADWTYWIGSSEPLSAPLSGAQIQSFGLPSFGPSGPAYLATLKPGLGAVSKGNDSVLLRSSDSTLLAREGDAAPGIAGATFKSFSDPVSGVDARTVFAATLAGVPTNMANTIWHSADGSDLQLLARSGDAAPGGGQWSKFISLALPDGFYPGPLFTATLANDRTAAIDSNNNFGLWGVDLRGELQLLLRTGQTVSVGNIGRKVKSFVALAAAPGANGAANGYDESGHVFVVVTLEDRGQALLKITIP